jgi:hypothetical protein
MHGGGPQTDGRTEDARRPHAQCAQAGDDPIRGKQVGSTLAATMEDQQELPEQRSSATTDRSPLGLTNRARVTIRSKERIG